ncbi:HlyD family secretion protein [Shewanella algae]|uniref:HlyD family secretion protein n=1 Tax=Shewanella algae TaxID=38313 RepID=UPI00046A171E|nr:HlyD family efflux transporter periplasmic adaptor subunit [Shewanella algae]NKZ41245.1 HlyD family efflux transporter periplasmic adaptor subunit [Shewanella algae]QTE78573.1 HlyD family efflux transporter periplasmic adaptor subunit [Shewanella algae]
MKVTYQAAAKAQQPTRDQGLKVDYAPAKRGGMKWRWYLLLLLVIAPVVLLLWVLLRPSLFVLAPGILTSEPLEMRAMQKGRLLELSVQPGSRVDAGLDASIDELQRQLAELTPPSLEQDLAILGQLEQRVLVAEQGVKRQDELLSQFESFRKQGVVPTADMAAVMQAHTSARMALEQARAELLQQRQLQQQERDAGVIAQSRNSLLLKLAELQAKRQQLTIQAPFAGRVADVLVQQGETIAEQQPMLWLSGRAQPVVVCYLAPKYLNYVAQGQQASVKLPNGTRIRAEIKEPTELVGKVPKQLSGPFDGDKPALKVTLALHQSLPLAIEGVPVEVSFDRF